MTVSVQTPYNSSTGNGVTTVFPYAFKILSADDLKVTVDNVLRTLGADYTVSGVGGNGGNVTFLVAPANGAIVVRYSDTLMKRDTDYQQNGDFREDVVDADFDRLWLGLRDTTSKADRSLRAPPGETFGDLPVAATRVSKLLGFDGSGVPALYAQSSLGTIVPTAFAEQLLDDASAADARVTLGVAAAANGVHTGTTTMDAATINGDATVGATPTVTGRTFVVANLSADAGASASSRVQSDAGVLQLTCGATAGGGSANVISSLTGALSIYSTQSANLRLGTGNRPDDIVVTPAGVVLIGGIGTPTGYASLGDVALPAARAVRAINTLKAWVNFDGTASSPITPRSHYNVASITKHSTGQYTANLTAGIFADANYSVTMGVGDAGSANFRAISGPRTSAPTTTAFRFQITDGIPNSADAPYAYLQFAGA
jgi:hypothetical protein